MLSTKDSSTKKISPCKLKQAQQSDFCIADDKSIDFDICIDYSLSSALNGRYIHVGDCVHRQMDKKTTIVIEKSEVRK